MNTRNYLPLTPFKGWVLENFPFIEADFDAITNYELICKITEYLNNVISNLNTVEENVTDAIDYINNYFNNLDLTEEVSNKLDEMALDGTLTNLIKDYVDPIYQAYTERINAEVEEQNMQISGQNSRIINIDNKVNSVASGSPAGVYDTVSDLQTADPSHDKIYVVIADGKWYYYSSSDTDWVAGGTYQATESSSDMNELLNFKNVTVVNSYYPTTDYDTEVYTIDVGHYYGQSGPVSSSNMTSYLFTAQQDFDLYFTNYNIVFTSICIYPSGSYPDDNYVRYRDVAGGEQSLPKTYSDKISISAGSLIAITVNNNVAGNPHFTIMTDGLISGYYLNPKVIQNDFAITLSSGNLNITGKGINMNFNNLTFNNEAGLFELQDLQYNGYVIFDRNNDYIGPVRVHGESIIGAKHGDETTTSYKIIVDGTEITTDGNYSGTNIDIIVNSAIDTRFTRLSSYSINKDSMVANSLITTLANMNIDYIFGAGIISCQDTSNIAWINKESLSTDVLTGLNEITTIVTKGGSLISKRLFNNTYNNNDHRVSFNVYSGRKKLYYYCMYGSDVSVPSGTTFASGAELQFK